MGAMLPARHSSVSQRLTASAAVHGDSDEPTTASHGRWLESWMPGRPWRPNGRLSATIRASGSGCRATGAGSVAGFGRRLAALTVDWFIGYGIAAMFATPDAGGQPLVRVAGARGLVRADGRAGRAVRCDAGMTVLGLRVLRVDGRRGRPVSGAAAHGADRGGGAAARRATATAAAGTTGRRARCVRTAVSAQRPLSVSGGARVRWTLRIFAPGGQRALRHAPAAREPSAARRFSSVVHLLGRDVARAACMRVF